MRYLGPVVVTLRETGEKKHFYFESSVYEEFQGFNGLEISNFVYRELKKLGREAEESELHQWMDGGWVFVPKPQETRDEFISL